MDEITTVISAPVAFKTNVIAKGRSFSLEQTNTPVCVTLVSRGLTGAPGSSGQAQISADQDNQITQGTDQRLYVPPAQAVSDPLAYYILAKG